MDEFANQNQIQYYLKSTRVNVAITKDERDITYTLGLTSYYIMVETAKAKNLNPYK